MGRVYPNISLYLVKILLYAKKEFGNGRDFMNQKKNSKKIENIHHLTALTS